MTNALMAEIEKAHKNKIEDTSGDLMTARLVDLTTEIGQLIVKSKPVLNAALYLFLFTTLN